MALQAKDSKFTTRFSGKHIIDYDVIIEVSDTVCYYGFCKVATAQSAAGWAIMKEVVSTPTGLQSKTVRTWANGTKEFDKVMDNYAQYTY